MDQVDLRTYIRDTRDEEIDFFLIDHLERRPDTDVSLWICRRIHKLMKAKEYERADLLLLVVKKIHKTALENLEKIHAGVTEEIKENSMRNPTSNI